MSSNFIVSARKYRPQTFHEMLGQEAICRTLLGAIKQDKIAHAYLFCGPRGVGKTSAARILSRNINCLHQTPNGEACGSCDNCRAALEQRSLNIYELDAASNNSADDIRRINAEVYSPPQYGRYKVYIIDEVHMLSGPAFNAFLKTLEEPPAHVVFILATTEKHKIPATILSRCQVYDFKPIPPEQISEQLQRVATAEGIQYDRRALDQIARIADGGMRDALSLFDRLASSAQGGTITYEMTLQVLNLLDDEYFFLFTTHLYSGQYSKVLLLLDELLSKGVAIPQITSGLAEFMRNLLVAQSPETRCLFPYSGSDADRFAEMAQQIHPLFLYKSISKLVICDRNYRSSQAKRLLVELTLMSIAEMCGAFKNRTEPSPTSNPTSSTTPSTTSSTASSTTTSTAPSTTSSTTTSTAPSTTSSTAPSTTTSTAPSTTTSTASSTAPSPPPPTKGEEKRNGMISIQAMRQAKKREKETANNQPATPADQRPLENQTITQEQLLKVWENFAFEELPNEVHISQIMKICLPTLELPHTIRITFISRIQSDNFAPIKPRLLQYLRHELHNDHIDLQCDIQEYNEETELLPRTPQEKVDYLSNKYPLLEKLIKDLNLRLY